MRLDANGVVKKWGGIPVRDLTCFLGRAFPISLVSMVEVIVLRGKTRGIKARWDYGFIGSEGEYNEIRDGDDLGSKTGAGHPPPEV